MSVRPYLPSARFTTIVAALALSGGLVIVAQTFTGAHPEVATLGSAPSVAGSAAQWQAALADVQAQENIKAPEAPSPTTVNDFLAAAQSTNLTATVGRTLLINLSNAKSQGLGDDAPTQDKIIAAAAAQVAATTTPRYAKSDLTTVPQNSASLHTWGNDLMRALDEHPSASASDTYAAIGAASDNQDASALQTLPAISASYADLAAALAALPVPETLAPLQLELANDFAQMADTYPDMATMITDPLRGLTGVQRYASLLDEATRVLTTIAQTLNKDGILFTKDEPGNTWSAFLSV